MEAGQRLGRWRREHCGSWSQGIGLMMGKRTAIGSGGGVEESSCRWRVGRGECVLAELAQDVVGAPAEFACDRQTGPVVVDALGDFQVVGVVG